MIVSQFFSEDLVVQPRQIAICEKTSSLTASLERAYLNQPEVTFRWLPYFSDFFEYLNQNRCDIAIFESENVSQDQLKSLSFNSRQTTLLAITSKNDFEFECLLRELGVVSVLQHEIGFERILQAFQRLLEN